MDRTIYGDYQGTDRMVSLFIFSFTFISFILAGLPAMIFLSKEKLNWVTCFSLSAWFGVLFYIVISSSIFHGVTTLNTRQFGPYVFIFLTLAGIASLIYLIKNKKISSAKSLDIFLFLTCIFTALLLITPLLTIASGGYYYSNNGEFINYAAVADMAQYHAANTHLKVTSFGFDQYFSRREIIVGLLCSIFSTVTKLSPLFTIEPFAAVIGLISFLLMGNLYILVLAQHDHVSLSKKTSILLLFLLAIFSAANFQFWSMSFVSQYINTCIFFGWLFFIIKFAPHQKYWSLLTISVAGLTLGVSAQTYPEVFIPTTALIIAALFFSTDWRDKNSLRARIIEIVLASSIAMLVGNVFAYHMIVKLASSSATIAAGWDIFGSNHKTLEIFGNLFGLRNLFWFQNNTYLFGLVVYLILLILAIKQTIKLTFTANKSPFKGLSATFLAYLVATTLLFLYTRRAEVKTNYVAAKFAIHFLWLIYIMFAIAIYEIRSKWIARIVVALLSGLLLITIYVSTIFITCFYSDSQKMVISQKEANEVQAIVNNDRNIYVSGALPLLGYYMVYGSNLAADSSKPQTDLMAAHYMVDFVVGRPDGLKIPKSFKLSLARPDFNLYKKQN